MSDEISWFEYWIMVFPPCAGADETVAVTRIAFCLNKSESPALP